MYYLYGAIIGAAVGLIVGAGVNTPRDPHFVTKVLALAVFGAIIGVVLVAVSQGVIK